MSTSDVTVQLGTLTRPVLDQIIHPPNTHERKLRHIGIAEASVFHTPSKVQPRLIPN